jgi:hypothetical protein
MVETEKRVAACAWNTDVTEASERQTLDNGAWERRDGIVETEMAMGE